MEKPEFNKTCNFPCRSPEAATASLRLLATDDDRNTDRMVYDINSIQARRSVPNSMGPQISSLPLTCETVYTATSDGARENTDQTQQQIHTMPESLCVSRAMHSHTRCISSTLQQVLGKTKSELRLGSSSTSTLRSPLTVLRVTRRAHGLFSYCIYLHILLQCAFFAQAQEQGANNSTTIFPVAPVGNFTIPVVPGNSTAAPTISPTFAIQLSDLPSFSPVVVSSSSPTIRPTTLAPTTMAPTFPPTISFSPTVSSQPSSEPTYSVPFVQRQLFRQQFIIPAKITFNETELLAINEILTGYTATYAPEANRVFTDCTVSPTTDSQTLSDCIDGLPECVDFTGSFINDVDYTCEWASTVTNITDIQFAFLRFMNNNSGRVLQDLQDAGLNVTSVQTVRPTTRSTPAPTISNAPSVRPSYRPTISMKPSFRPTVFPTSPQPSSAAPTVTITFPPPTIAPTRTPSPDNALTVAAIVSIVVGAGFVGLLCLFVFFVSQRRRKFRDGSVNNYPPSVNYSQKYGNESYRGNLYDGQSEAGPAFISPGGSLASKQSLISDGESNLGGESADEMDGTRNLQDEFDQYKDQNLEQLRTDVEDSVAGFEGIMSAALTRALMSGTDDYVDPKELSWSCAEPFNGYDIEASALWEVNDWMKRNENASVERKRVFMQELLNRTVSSVRHGYLFAADAARTIHESAALLGLPLANDLPMTTVIVSGMRKTVTTVQMISALKEFGDVDTAAVASRHRGFGIVRFRQSKAADRALNRYRSSEIVVQDVAVQIQVLMPSGVVESRSQGRSMLS